MDISIILVNHNTPKLTEEAVAAAKSASRRAACEFFVVDNSSNESLRYAGPERKMVVDNRGFGSACNIGAKVACGRYLLFLNTDTVLHGSAIDDCLTFMDTEQNVGALGIRTLLPNGRLDRGCKRGFPTPASAFYYYLGLEKKYPQNPKYGQYHLTYLSDMETHDVDSVSGSFLMMPRQVFEKLGGFDERFFMYGEDLDVCYRVKKNGLRVVYFAGATMTHLGGSSIRESSPKARKDFYDAMMLFYDKHYKDSYNFLVSAIVRFGVSMLRRINTSNNAKGKLHG